MQEINLWDIFNEIPLDEKHERREECVWKNTKELWGSLNTPGGNKKIYKIQG